MFAKVEGDWPIAKSIRNIVPIIPAVAKPLKMGHQDALDEQVEGIRSRINCMLLAFLGKLKASAAELIALIG